MMKKSSERSRRRSSDSRTLGQLLKDLRNAKRLSLRDVEEATEKEVSNAYLSQLENDRISKPHPNILYCLAAVYGVPYESLMKKAGYITPGPGGRIAAFAIDDLTPQEEEELLEYLAFIRSRRRHEEG